MDTTVPRCAICGKRPWGICPALEKIICAACCGSGRGSKIRCVSSCVYFPFNVAGYDLWLEVDSKLVRKKLDYLKSYYSYREFEEMVEQMRFASVVSGEDAGTAEGAAVYYLFFVKRDANGRTLAQKWQLQGWLGLNNDERIMMECRFNCRAVKDFILGDVLFSEYFDVFLFEDAPAKSRSVESIYLGEVKKSDIYIGIIGQQYGAVGKNKMSPTEKEAVHRRS